MPRVSKKKKTYRASDDQRALAKAELAVYLDALLVDPQYAVRRLCTLVEILTLPNRITKANQLHEVMKLLALRREKTGWGRSWSLGQLQRLYYLKSSKDWREMPHPVTKEELARYVPKIPPIHAARLAAKEAQAHGAK